MNSHAKYYRLNTHYPPYAGTGIPLLGLCFSTGLSLPTPTPTKKKKKKKTALPSLLLGPAWGSEAIQTPQLAEDSQDRPVTDELPAKVKWLRNLEEFT